MDETTYTPEEIRRLLDPDQVDWPVFCIRAVPAIEFLLTEIDRLRSAESVSLALEDALNDGRLVKPASSAAPNALDLENAILWTIQYMHIHYEPDMLRRMFEWAVRECYAVNTSRETEGALRAMLQVARDNAYLWPDEWDQLIDTYGPSDSPAE